MEHEEKSNNVGLPHEITQRISNLVYRFSEGNRKNFADKINLPQQNFNRLFNVDKRTNKYPKPTDEIINRVLGSFPEVSKVWLLTGKGEMISGLTIENKSTAKKTYESGRPYYDGDWELGFRDSFDENLVNPEFNIDFPPANQTEGFWMRGRGKSMLGEIDPGDYLYFSELKDFSWFPFGRIYGIVTKNKMRTVKRVVQSETPNHYKLISTNPDKISYPDQDIPMEMVEKMFEVKFVIKNLDE